MFKPKYKITDLLLANITRINSLIGEMNNRRFPKLVLFEFEKKAREISAHASTSIEGNPLSLTDVKRILKQNPVNLRDTEKEVVNYNQALELLNERIKDNNLEISLKLILDIHKTITHDLLSSTYSGKLRKKPVIVNDPKTRKTVYLPPNAEDVKKLIFNLIKFINQSNNSLDPLIIAGIFHKQMVIIHPFIDGNGRTTRLATKVLLAKMGLNTFNLFSFENYYNQNVTKYFQNVGEYGDYYELETNIDFTNWLEYFTGGLIDEILRVQKILPEIGNSPQTHLEEHHLQILKIIKQNGYVKDSDYSKVTSRAKATRALDFQKLLDFGLIKRQGKGKSTYYTLAN